LQQFLSEAVSRHQIKPLSLPSGAGHDAMAMADLCPVGMLFVRCTDGISHNPVEFASQSDIDQAIAILLDAVEHLAASYP
jgi:allantoate deiminase